jgi:hypothetical protein
MASPGPESTSMLDPDMFVEPQVLIPASTTQQSIQPTDSIASKKGPRTSFVWKHMPGPVNTIYTQGKHVYWRCQYCPREYRESGGTAFIARHLRTEHNITDE